MPRHDGTSNLIPLNKRSKEEQREIRSKAGKASGKVRRWNADIKACILEKLGEDATMEAFVSSMLAEAMNGNVAAANFIRDTSGQKPVEKSDSRMTGSFTFGWEGEDAEDHDPV